MTVTSTSPQGVAAIAFFEGRKLTPYQDKAGYWTIGVGHKLLPAEMESGLLCTGPAWRDGITDEQCTALLAHDLAATEHGVMAAVTVPIVQAEFDTLVSFAFNVGVPAFTGSTLLRLLNGGDYLSVPGQLQRWVFDGGKEDPILERRRADEAAMWDGTYPA